MTEVILDTDILSFFLKGNSKVFLKFQKYLETYNYINISIITYYEILSGLNFNGAVKQLEVFDNFCLQNKVLNLTTESIKASSAKYAEQRKAGKTIDDIDLLIAGIAISNNFTLITNNTRHFERIKGLRIENWNS